MKFQPQRHIVKSGKPIIIRAAQIEDAQNLINLKTSYISTTTTIPMTVEEYAADMKSEISLISQYLKSKNSILLVAELGDELIGNIDLTGSIRSKMNHTAMLGMGIKEQWRNQGVGRLLIESALNWSQHNSEIQLVWLDVYASNDLGCSLYKKTGFIESGRINGLFKEKEEYIDKIQMYQRIS